jgi:hypothetical protein
LIERVDETVEEEVLIEREDTVVDEIESIEREYAAVKAIIRNSKTGEVTEFIKDNVPVYDGWYDTPEEYIEVMKNFKSCVSAVSEGLEPNEKIFHLKKHESELAQLRQLPQTDQLQPVGKTAKKMVKSAIKSDDIYKMSDELQEIYDELSKINLQPKKHPQKSRDKHREKDNKPAKNKKKY